MKAFRNQSRICERKSGNEVVFCVALVVQLQMSGHWSAETRKSDL